jgi:pimeloyl-ACP methyl ester carboxylesterase
VEEPRPGRSLAVVADDISLGGSLWLPEADPAATVLMHPGSGPSDRHNDVFFPPIRRALLAAGVAVSSFDKRGVGESGGHWEEAAIEAQADDALACLGALRGEVGDPVGLFGHSQGGWVVVDAAARGGAAAFAVVSSGPGVTPGEQERYAVRTRLIRAGAMPADLEEANRYVDGLLSLMRAGVDFDEARRLVEREGTPAALRRLELPLLPASEVEWKLLSALIDYDPRPALERIDVPVLALFGEADPVIPVEESVAVFREAVRPDLLHVEVFAGAGHRLEVGDPPRLADGYLDTLTTFVLEASGGLPTPR